MSEWTFYSPSTRYPSAGELLKAIPSRRNLRMERVVEEGDEVLAEAVRAAEQLLDLDVTLRLQNDPDGAIRFRLSEVDDDWRRRYAALSVPGGPDVGDISIVAQLNVHETAVASGHVDLVDDVVCGLERVFPGGVAHNPAGDEAVLGREIVRIMDPEQTRWSHLDVKLRLAEEQHAYVVARLVELPSAMQSLIFVGPEQISIRGRFPCQLEAETVDRVWHALLDLVPFASGGYVRLREEGVWQDLVSGVGTQDIPALPEEWLRSRKKGLIGILSRLFRGDG